MEERLRLAVDLLGDSADHGPPIDRILVVAEELNSLVPATPEAILSECLTSPEMVQLLASDSGGVCAAAVRLLSAVARRLGRQVSAALADREGFLELLDELVYKLSTVADVQCARSIVMLLLGMLEHDGDVLELFSEHYRGIRPVLKRWQGNGFDLMLKKFGDVVVSGDLELAEAEHRRRAATLIQAQYRGHRLRRRLADATGTIARLQRRIRARRGRAARQRLVQLRQEREAFSSALERQRQRRRHTERVLQNVSDISAEKVPRYMRERRRAAAARIQSAWRAYRVRAQLDGWREQWRRHRAAVTVQRWWRHCLVRMRAERDETAFELTAEDVEKYQRQIDSTLEAALRDGLCPALPRSELSVQLAESQALFSVTARRLARAAAGRRRCGALLAQTQAIAGLLERPAGSRPPADYWCPSRALAAQARRAHRRAAARAQAPWWRRLADSDEEEV